MTKHDLCNIILAGQNQMGCDVIDNSDMWDEEDCDYYIVNYSSHLDDKGYIFLQMEGGEQILDSDHNKVAFIKE